MLVIVGVRDDGCAAVALHPPIVFVTSPGGAWLAATGR